MLPCNFEFLVKKKLIIIVGFTLIVIVLNKVQLCTFDNKVITFTKEVLFLSIFVCLSVCLLIFVCITPKPMNKSFTIFYVGTA